MYQYAITIAVFSVCAVTDIRYKKIYRSTVAVYLALAFAGHLAVWLRGGAGTAGILPDPAANAALALVPGMACLLLSVFSGQALGYGDSLMILACGISLGFFACVSVLMTAFLGAGALGILQICFCGAGRKKELAFFPFLLAGAVLQALISIC